MDEKFLAEYRKHLDNPFLRVLVEVAYLADDELLNFIRGAGPGEYADALTQLRQQIETTRRNIKGFSMEATRLHGQIAATARQIDEYKVDPPMRRCTVTRRLIPAGHVMDSVSSRYVKLSMEAQGLETRRAQSEQTLKGLERAEKNLADALQRYLLQRGEPAGTTPTPVVNVTVTPEINFPDEFKITAMPTRETVSTIVYDSSGNIISTTQTERDATTA